MKETCAIVKDLLPLYVDGMCSYETEKFIEMHIENCESCKNILSLMMDQNDDSSNDKSDIKIIEGIAKQWKQDKLKSLLSGGAIVAFIISVVSILLYSSADVYVDANGTLVEPFYLIGFFYLFLFLGVMLSLMVLIKKKINSSRKNKNKSRNQEDSRKS